MSSLTSKFHAWKAAGLSSMSTRKSQELAAQVDLGVLDGLLSFYVRVFEIAVSRHLDDRLAPLGFTGRKGTISSLLLIARHAGIRPTTISTLLGIDKSITVKTVDELRRAKLVTRRSAADDKRAQELFVTPEGAALADKVETLIVAHSDEFFAGLMTREEHDIVVNIFRKAFNRLREVGE